MRILAGQDQEYEGTLQLSPGIKVGYLQQEPLLDMNSTVLENIAPALAPTKAMLTEFEEVGLGHCIDADITLAQPRLLCVSEHQSLWLRTWFFPCHQACTMCD